MEEKSRVIEIRKTFTREAKDEKTEKIIFERQGDDWVYKAPDSQTHTVEQLEDILAELKKLTK